MGILREDAANVKKLHIWYAIALEGSVSPRKLY